MGKQRMSSWPRLLAATLLAATLAGCGGGDSSTGPAGPAGADGGPGPAGPPGPPGVGAAGATSVGSNALTNTAAIQTNAQAWAALEPTVTVTSVTIASP